MVAEFWTYQTELKPSPGRNFSDTGTLRVDKSENFILKILNKLFMQKTPILLENKIHDHH